MKKFVFVLAALCLLGLFSACGNETGQEGNAGPLAPSFDDGASPAPSASAAVEEQGQEPEAFPAFDCADIYGNAVSSELFEDHTLTVVNVWATWCGPCVNELPHLAQLESTFEDENVRVLGILLEEGDEAVETAKTLLDSAGATYTVFQPEGELLETLYSSILYFPTTYFVDGEGNIVGEPSIGAMDFSGWKAAVQAALEG